MPVALLSDTVIISIIVIITLMIYRDMKFLLLPIPKYIWNNKTSQKFLNISKTHALPLDDSILYSAKRWWGKTLANQSFQSFGEENVGKFKLLVLS